MVRGGSWVGGAVTRIDEGTQENWLDLFFVDVANHGKGIGSAAWRALEGRYPQTRV